MKRTYASGTISATINFFVGKEVEHTPAYNMLTLFVTGLQTIKEIESTIDNYPAPITHIFFGANHSYDPASFAVFEMWENMIMHFLNQGMLCSLDIPINQVEKFNDGALCEHNNFIPQIRVPIAYTQLWNYNTMIKIDDVSFNATNPGVWTHSLHSLMDRSKFTSWAAYNSDIIIN